MHILKSHAVHINEQPCCGASSYCKAICSLLQSESGIAPKFSIVVSGNSIEFNATLLIKEDDIWRNQLSLYFREWGGGGPHYNLGDADGGIAQAPSVAREQSGDKDAQARAIKDS